LATDNRLKIFDHICDINGKAVHCESLTTLKVHQLFHVTYEKTVNFTVYRADPPELEKFNVEFMKKSGKELGLSLTPNERGCTICDIVCSLYSHTKTCVFSYAPIRRYKDNIQKSIISCNAAIL